MKNFTYVLIILFIIGALLRFYNLNWGTPYYFHPDERNIASSVSQLLFPAQMNPNFFAYGSLPIYVIFIVGQLKNLITCYSSLVTCHVPFEQAILISRILAAVCSTLLIPLMYLIGEKLYNKTAGITAAILTTFSVGLIQFAHFGTYEMLITFFSTLLFFIILLLFEKPTMKYVIALGILSGVLISLKVSSLVLLPLVLLALLLYHGMTVQKVRKSVPTILRDILIVLSLTGFLFVLTNPFVLIDRTAFSNSMQYETTLAAGALPVFYTQEFYETIPLSYQFMRIYPFLLNPLVTLAFIPAFMLFLYSLTRKKSVGEVFLLLFFLVLFVSQAVLFVKWTRYVVPTIPFMYLILIGAWYHIMRRYTQRTVAIPLRIVGITALALVCAVFAFSYVYEVFVLPDTRIRAAVFAKQRIPGNASILSEVYDLGIVPFNPYFRDVTLFNFYDMETESPEASPARLSTILATTDYIILPSQRLYKTRTVDSERFPHASAFYTQLMQEQQFKKIYETPCSLTCKIVYLGDPIFSYEGTATVFDRPTVMIYKKHE